MGGCNKDWGYCKCHSISLPTNYPGNKAQKECSGSGWARQMDGFSEIQEGTEFDTKQDSYDLMTLEVYEVSLSGPDKDRWAEEWRLMCCTWLPEAFICRVTLLASDCFVVMKHRLQPCFLSTGHFWDCEAVWVLGFTSR